jgi:ATP-dependent protease ClpP protease subunit
MIHRSSTNLQGASIDRVSAALTNLNVEDERIQGILRRELRLSRDHWAAFAKSDLMLSASDALAVGLADEIVTFTPSPGCSLLSI